VSSLFDLLTKLEKEQWSGEIAITSSQGNATILLREGQFIWAHRPLDRAIERLSKFSWLKLPPETVLRNCKTWEDFVRMLLHSNPDSYSQLVRFLKTDRLELFFRLFFWSNVELGQRPFAVALPDPVELNFYSTRKLSTLLKEANRRLHEWPQIQESIGSSKRIFICQIDLPPENDIPRDAIDQAFLEKEDTISAVLPFTLEEIELLRLCDGTRTIQDLVKESMDGEFLTLRRLLNLWEKNAVTPKDDQNFKSSRVSKPNPLKLMDIGMLCVLSPFLGLVFYGMMMLDQEWGRAPVSSVPVQIELEAFKSRHGRYPLTLSELKDGSLPVDDVMNRFDYKLLHPLQYQLVVK